jgi:putative phosphoribosyl transferase
MAVRRKTLIMAANARIGRIVPAPETAFRNRFEAGEALAEFMAPGPDPMAIVLAVPRGGVPVAEGLARALRAPLDIALVRKLPLPRWPEAGFGAVAIDGSTVLNEDLIAVHQLSPRVIERVKNEVLAEVRRRAHEYRDDDQPPAVSGRNVYLVDDGLASGYTMIAAVKMARNGGARSVTVCVPVSPVLSIERISPFVDHVHCLIAQEEDGFAVASFYADFHDLTDEQVREITRRNTRRDSGTPAGPA